MSGLKTPNQFRSKPALLIVAAAGLVLAYALLTRAIDTGSWWQYLSTLLVVILSFRLIGRAIRKK